MGSGRVLWEARVNPVDEMVMILVDKEGRVESIFNNDWVTRLGGEMTKPFVTWNFGVPPDICTLESGNNRKMGGNSPTVMIKTSTPSLSGSPFAASSQAFLQSSRTR